jgi:hypothetical protein
LELGIFDIGYEIFNVIRGKRVYRKAREPSAGTRLKAGRRPAAEASDVNAVLDCMSSSKIGKDVIKH